MKFFALVLLVTLLLTACGRNTPPAEDGPLYPGLSWSAPQQVVVLGKPAIAVESVRRTDLAGSEVLGFYMDWIERNGWTSDGPAGSNAAWTLSAVSGKEALQVSFSADAGIQGDAQAGALLRIVHWLDRPAAFPE